MLQATLLSALLMGLIGSTHCVGMCGGIISTLSTDFSGQRRSHNPFIIQLFYNIGRILSYSLIGLLSGLFSTQLVQLLPHPHMLQMRISGAFFILLGLYISQLFNALGWLERAGQTIWKRIEPFGRKYLPAQDYPSALKLGLVWGWLPCGLVYAALALAVTQTSAIYSAATMLVFGIGTLPALLVVGHFAQNVRLILQNRWVRLTLGLLLIAYGVAQIIGYSPFMVMKH